MDVNKTAKAFALMDITVLDMGDSYKDVVEVVANAAGEPFDATDNEDMLRDIAERSYTRIIETDSEKAHSFLIGIVSFFEGMLDFSEEEGYECEELTKNSAVLHSLKILKEYAVEEGICVKEYEKIIGKLEK